MTRIIRTLVFALALVSQCASAGKATVLIIVNARVAEGAINLHELASIYLRRRVVWSDGHPIIPVNQDLGSAIRRKFSRLVFGEPPAALADYWSRMHFQGIHPPVVMPSDRAVVAFVRTVPGAIGYVHANTPADGTKILGHL